LSLRATILSQFDNRRYLFTWICETCLNRLTVTSVALSCQVNFYSARRPGNDKRSMTWVW